ncbi:hypothetical protein V9T40_007518 [Parthenolecanium corni]|uniref:Uncharacterized protein n=1 Tax=Parthenolecanium corni TaxID=536013 RepID=A0AAN9Y664_9HEMI
MAWYGYGYGIGIGIGIGSASSSHVSHAIVGYSVRSTICAIRSDRRAAKFSRRRAPMRLPIRIHGPRFRFPIPRSANRQHPPHRTAPHRTAPHTLRVYPHVATLSHRIVPTNYSFTSASPQPVRVPDASQKNVRHEEWRRRDARRSQLPTGAASLDPATIRRARAFPLWKEPRRAARLIIMIMITTLLMTSYRDRRDLVSGFGGSGWQFCDLRVVNLQPVGAVQCRAARRGAAHSSSSFRTTENISQLRNGLLRLSRYVRRVTPPAPPPLPLPNCSRTDS